MNSKNISDSQQIVIPVSGPEFAEFITNLLGQRRTIEREFFVDYLMISYEQILSLTEVINQRVSQNTNLLTSFKCVYYFATGRVITLFSIDDFRHYADYAPDQTVGVDINLTFLIDFPGNKTPERQDIRVEIFSHDRIRYSFGRIGTKADPLVKYTISATNLTWGEDISNHLRQQIENFLTGDILTRINRVLRAIFRFTGLAGILATLGGLGLVVRYGILNTMEKKAYITDQLGRIGEQASIMNINERINLLLYEFRVAKSADLDWGNIFSWRNAVGVFAIAVLFGAIIIVRRQGNSAIVAMNNFTARKLSETLRTREFIAWGFYIGLAVGVVGSVIAARIDRILF